MGWRAELHAPDHSFHGECNSPVWETGQHLLYGVVVKVHRRIRIRGFLSLGTCSHCQTLVGLKVEPVLG